MRKYTLQTDNVPLYISKDKIWKPGSILIRYGKADVLAVLAGIVATVLTGQTILADWWNSTHCMMVLGSRVCQ
jgi:hypothetical protein